jgi:CheY-like chemotaxis protein
MSRKPKDHTHSPWERPASFPTSSQAINPNSMPVAGRPLRILFADDQDDIRILTAYQLKRSGHTVVTAKDGKKALKMFRSASFDVVLLDQEMPGMTGSEVARAIRKDESGKKTRVFLVASTGNTSLEDARSLKLAGFDDVLGKPFRLEDLNLILSSSPASKPASRSASLPSPAPGATYTELVARVGGVTGIASAIRRRDSESLASLAHALKGSVSIFGAESARKHAQDLQELGRSGDLAAAQEILISLKEDIAKLQANLRGYANQTPARPKSDHDKRQRPPRNRGKRRR